LNKITFVNQLCGSEKPENGFDIAMGYDALVNTAWDILKRISETHKSKGDINVERVDFKSMQKNTLSIPFRFTSRCRNVIENCDIPLPTENGFYYQISEGKGTLYILKIAHSKRSLQ